MSKAAMKRFRCICCLLTLILLSSCQGHTDFRSVSYEISDTPCPYVCQANYYRRTSTLAYNREYRYVLDEPAQCTALLRDCVRLDWSVKASKQVGELSYELYSDPDDTEGKEYALIREGDTVYCFQVINTQSSRVIDGKRYMPSGVWHYNATTPRLDGKYSEVAYFSDGTTAHYWTNYADTTPEYDYYMQYASYGTFFNIVALIYES